MIQAHTNLKVIDNTGARVVQCIKVLGGSKRKVAKIGDIIVVSIKSAIPRSKVKKGEVHRALIVRTKKEIQRKDGTFVKFDNNTVVLVNLQNAPIGSRIFGPVSKELRKKDHMKVISLASGVL